MMAAIRIVLEVFKDREDDLVIRAITAIEHTAPVQAREAIFQYCNAPAAEPR